MNAWVKLFAIAVAAVTALFVAYVALELIARELEAAEHKASQTRPLPLVIPANDPERKAAK